MKNFFRTGIILAASLLLTAPLAASAVQQFDQGEGFYPQLSDIESKDMKFTKPTGSEVKLPPEVILYPAPQFTAETEDTGASLTALYGTAPIPVIEYPSTTIEGTAGPSASVSLLIPPGFDGSLKSVIAIKFLSGSSMVAGSISGSVTFAVEAEVIHTDETSEIIDLGTIVTKNVESAGPTVEGKISANQYTAKVKFKNKFTSGDTGTLKLTRINDDAGNYGGSIYVPALFLKYNIGNTAKVQSKWPY